VARFGSDDVGFFLVGGYNLLGTLTQFQDKVAAITEESHTLGDAWTENAAVGVKSWEMSQEGFYDDDTLSVHDALEGAQGASWVLCYNVEGNTSGEEFVGISGALQLDYERIVSRNELHKARAEYRLGAGVYEPGRIIRPLAGASATGNTTAAAIDFGASNITGLQVDIMHSADNLTFASHQGFASVTSTNPSAQRISSTAPIQRYVAARWTGGTGFPTSAVFFVGFSPR
jgi:hypothetical protein